MCVKMSEEDKKPMLKNKSVPNSLIHRTKPSLLQTRRHSWFGASQEVPLENKFEKGADIFDIKEETEEANEKENSTSWWNFQQWSKKNRNTNDEGLRHRKSSSSKSKKVSFQDDSCALRNEKIGLPSAPKNVSFEKPTSPKRRSGFGNWLPKKDLNDSVFVDDNSAGNAASVTKESIRKQPSFERASQRRATVHYSSNGRPSLMDLKRRAFQQPLKANEIRALEQFKDVSRDFIVYRLRQRNLANRVVLDRQQSKDRWLTREIIFIFCELEKIHSCRFSDISKQIGITLRSEDVLRKVFLELSGEIITTEIKSNHQNGTEKPNDRTNSKKPLNNPTPKSIGLLPSFGSRYTEITWGRLCAVLAVAGGLAVDCVQQGHADLVNHLVEYVGDFAKDEDVLPWIVKQGGWEGLREMTFETTSGNAAPDSCYLGKVTNIAMAFVFCTITSVIVALIIATFARLK